MEIRKAYLSEIEELAAIRTEFINSLISSEMTISEEFETNANAYMRKHMADDSMVSWVAVEDGKIVSTAMVCYYELLPIMLNQSGKYGYIYNVYTLPEYRKRGLASQLLNKIKEEAKERQIGQLQLRATEMGKLLYEKLGFELLNREMAYIVI
ncbi:GNAT family N-acetyltransferase [Lachnospiraceae bacterium MD1]|uniref:GNAT family N-acetyltransferase n=1 Tax=Variimorphobacter saccharofermentans TaxID=2755051 RepID=A0A839JXG2_9FIRM|nr:GNAT family N-acetyltransferase [Variimorphobacter saccharofermentans]MBB2182086.1 GNAT family N-acetyltransferase [Variimorphobacter saccharofermentans]